MMYQKRSYGYIAMMAIIAMMHHHIMGKENVRGDYQDINAVQHEMNIDQKKTERRPLKILCVVGCFPLISETSIINQITGLGLRGHKVTVFSYHKGQKKVHPDVAKYRLLDKDKAYFGELPPDIAEYDIIICQFGPLGKKFVKIRKELGLKAKLVTCFRGYDITQEVQSKGRHVYDSLFASPEQGGVELFLPVCYYFKDLMVDLGCDPNRIKVHRSAIDLERFTYREKRPGQEIVIASVHRLIAKKGTEYTIKAVCSLLPKYPNIHYRIMGDGPLKSELMNITQRNSGQRNIEFLGWGTHKEVPILLNSADFFVLASLTAKNGNEEGIPNALKEAMAMGVPVISTWHAGIAELISNGKTGLLVKSGDSKAIADAIQYLIDHPEECQRMVRAARKHIEDEYDKEKVNDLLVERFYELLGL